MYPDIYGYELYGFRIKHKIKMAGYSAKFFCMFMDWDRVEVQLNLQKKNETNIQPSWQNKLGQ